MAQHILKHVIYGTAIVNNTASDTPDVLAISEGLSPEQIKPLMKTLPLSPLTLDGIQQSQAIALVIQQIGEASYTVLARAHFQQLDLQVPAYQLIVMSGADAVTFQNFDALLAFFNAPIPSYSVINAPLELLNLMQTDAPSRDKQVMLLGAVLEDLMNEQFHQLTGILSLAIQGNVVIRNFPDDAAKRIQLVRGIRLLLPISVRHLLTFTTNANHLGDNLPHITFSDDEAETDATICDWEALSFSDDNSTHLYITQLNQAWNENVIDLVDLIARYNQIAEVLLSDETSLATALQTIATRHQMDTYAIRGEQLPTEQILEALESDIPMSLDLQTAYAILLLEQNFDDRNPETSQIIAGYIDQDEDLSESLEPFFNSSIETQPDAVYSFVRSHLHSTDTAAENPRWLRILHDSAQVAINIAIGSGDPNTIRSWLVLISREPSRYQLSDIIADAIERAQAFVADSPELAQEILVVAVKRQPEMIPDLLDAKALVDALPETTRQAIIEQDSSAIDVLNAESRELFMLSLRRAIDNQAAVITSTAIRNLWQNYAQQQTKSLPTSFRSSTLIRECVANPETLLNGAYGTLLALCIADKEHDELFVELVAALASQEQISETLASAIQQGNRPRTANIELIGTLLSQNAITPQIAVSTLAGLLVNSNWLDEDLPYAEQLSRLMSQYPDTDAATGVLWKLLELSEKHKNEQMLKVSLRRLLEHTGNLVKEDQIVQNVKTIRRDSSWSQIGKSVFIRWWRSFSREQGSGQLQKIDKLLEGNRMDDLRAIVQTNVAIRRIIGNRTLEEFAEAVASAYTLLQSLSEGFDPSDKLVDSFTIRQEMEARAEELPPQLRPVLSTNLRELAQLVTTLSENRSKPSLIRSDDTVERQLVTGEQDPASAIDVMRWLSGYLDGIQKGDSDE